MFLFMHCLLLLPLNAMVLCKVVVCGVVLGVLSIFSFKLAI